MSEKTQASVADDTSNLVVGVRFNAVGKVYHFDATAHPDLRVEDFVIVTTARGQQLGQIVVVGPPDSGQTRGPLKAVERRATGRDLAIRKHWENKELQALIQARELNTEIGLPIKLVRAEYSFDGKRLTFFYSAQERKETKALRKRLAQAFRARVEIRQIGPRDVAKVMGGYGACGEPRCCSEFLTEFCPISIRMAKAQGISLSPSEITGMCGRLRCCLNYEYEQYAQAHKRLPKRGKRVGTPFGEGKVVSLLPLKETALVDLGDKRVQVHSDDIVPLEEWRASQAQAAQPDERGEAQARDHKQQQTQADKSRRPSRPRSQRSTPAQSQGRTKAETQKPPPPDGEQKSKPSRRRRHRRRKR